MVDHTSRAIPPNSGSLTCQTSGMKRWKRALRSLIRLTYELLRLWDFIRNFFLHLYLFLPAGIVGAHLGGEIVAQLAQLVAQQVWIVVDVSETFALIGD